MRKSQGLSYKRAEDIKMNEFDLIKTYFAPLSRDGLRDDCATIEVPRDYDLVMTSDTLNEGVHFLSATPAADIARKALRVNLSDLASSAATPYCYQLNIAFPQKPSKAWLEEFSAALKQENETYKIYCSGGDTTSITGNALSLSITALGFVPKGKATKRQNAEYSDSLIITGACGDAALALHRKETTFLPTPRTNVTETLRNHVNAAADISDGLLADSMNIARASGLGLEVDLNEIKFSQSVTEAINKGEISYEAALKGGDDYELALAVPEHKADTVMQALKEQGLTPQKIGRFISQGHGLVLKNLGERKIDKNELGWVHF